MSVAISDWLDKLVLDHMRSEWVSHRRALNEPQAREDLLAGANLYSYKPGTNRQIPLFAGADRVERLHSPVWFSDNGLFCGEQEITAVLPVEGCDLRLVAENGRDISRLNDVTEVAT